jgi:hypothetical protein
MDFEEFCAAALSVHQLEALDRWEQRARCAYELFEKDGNRAIVIEELASVCLSLILQPYKELFAERLLVSYILDSINLLAQILHLKCDCNRIWHVEKQRLINLIFQELGLGPSVPPHAVLHDWIRHTDGKLSFLGFVKLLRGASSRILAKAQ